MVMFLNPESVNPSYTVDKTIEFQMYRGEYQTPRPASRTIVMVYGV